jgi:hypothetical protein
MEKNIATSYQLVRYTISMENLGFQKLMLHISLWFLAMLASAVVNQKSFFFFFLVIEKLVGGSLLFVLMTFNIELC